MSNDGVHFNKALDIALKKQMQEAFEEEYPKMNFIKVFGKSYL